VPAHLLHDIVRKLPDGVEIDIAKDGERNRLTISSGQSRFALQTLPTEDFPDLAAGEMSHEFEIGAGEIKRLIDKTRFAISTEETRYSLSGFCLHQGVSMGQLTLRAVLTGGHRLGQGELELHGGAEGMPGVMIPRNTVRELARLTAGSGSVVNH